MALAVIGGLLFSTVLSLVFVPAMFMVMDDIGSLFWHFGKKLIANTGDAEHAEDHHAAPPASSARPPSAIAPAAE
jgi:hypothetical protein